jgi:hypothetical protein
MRKINGKGDSTEKVLRIILAILITFFCTLEALFFATAMLSSVEIIDSDSILYVLLALAIVGLAMIINAYILWRRYVNRGKKKKS